MKKCPNFLVCNQEIPNKWPWKTCDIPCDMHFGRKTLNFKVATCPVCLEETTCVELKCNHFLCVKCFKRCTLGDWGDNPDLTFDWETSTQEQINEHNEKYRIWEKSKEEQYTNEKYLRKCPLCREWF